MDTPCKDCVFARYNGKTQIGCKLWMLDQLRKRTEIIEAYDEEKEFYVIKDKVCVCWRDKEWADSRGDKDLEECVRNEIAIYMDLVVYVPSERTTEDLLRTLNDAAKQTPKFRNVIIVINGARIALSKIRTLCQREFGNFWKIELMIDETAEKNDAVQVAASQIKSLYFLVVDAGTEIASYFNTSINNLLNMDCKPFLVLMDDNDEPELVQTLLFKLTGGNVEKPFVQKLENILRSQPECQHLVLKTKEVVAQALL